MPKRASARFREIRKRARELKVLGISRKGRRGKIPVLINPEIRDIFDSLSEQERKSALHLFSKDVKIRSRGVSSLADLGSKKSIPLLNKMLGDPIQAFGQRQYIPCECLDSNFLLIFLRANWKNPIKVSVLLQ